jgi:ubiquinone/menaquinone biosynthesis C-methylase UbiE
LDIEYLDLPGEHIPLADHTMDTVVSTFTLCTVSDIQTVTEEIGRVLRPSGKLIFFELGLAPDVTVQHWQKGLEPIFRLLFQGLHLTRDIPFSIRQGGFQIAQINADYLATFPKSLSYCWWGTAMLKPRVNDD